MTKKYYVEFMHENSNAENYDMQSRWFNTKRCAKEWIRLNFDFIDDDMNVFIMTAEFDGDSYDIVKSERFN